VIETPRKKRRRFIWPRARRNAERLAGDWIDRTALAACWLDTSIAKASLLSGRPAQRHLSNKQSLVICANFERGLFKNAARPPVDDFISRSQN
jgi:hypothetical protein